MDENHLLAVGTESSRSAVIWKILTVTSVKVVSVSATLIDPSFMRPQADAAKIAKIASLTQLRPRNAACAINNHNMIKKT